MFKITLLAMGVSLSIGGSFAFADTSGLGHPIRSQHSPMATTSAAGPVKIPTRARACGPTDTEPFRNSVKARWRVAWHRDSAARQLNVAVDLQWNFALQVADPAMPGSLERLSTDVIAVTDLPHQPVRLRLRTDCASYLLSEEAWAKSPQCSEAGCNVRRKLNQRHRSPRRSHYLDGPPPRRRRSPESSGPADQ